MRKNLILLLISLLFFFSETYGQWKVIDTTRYIEWDQPPTELEFIQDKVIVYTAQFIPPNPSGQSEFNIRRTINDCDHWGGILLDRGSGFGFGQRKARK